jgi:hypothetical protein
MREGLLSEALAEVDEQLQSRLERHCFTQVYRRADGTAMLGYGFLSLLGAMWIQMGWLQDASEKDVRRCLWCNKPIAFKQGKPPVDPGRKKNVRGRYKTRVDIEFCPSKDKHYNSKCRSAYNYHYVTKPKRSTAS